MLVGADLYWMQQEHTARLRSCSAGHSAIRFDGDACPLCEERRTRATLDGWEALRGAMTAALAGEEQQPVSLGVVIPCRDRTEALVGCLAALRPQVIESPLVPVVVVDAGSRTPLRWQMSDWAPLIVRIEQARWCKGEAVNAGLHALSPTCSHALLLDADIILHPEALARLRAWLRTTGAVAIAPLDNSEFNRYKSNIKTLEFGACGYPVVASNVEPYRWLASGSKDDGILVGNEGEWDKPREQRALAELERAGSRIERIPWLPVPAWSHAPHFHAATACRRPAAALLVDPDDYVVLGDADMLLLDGTYLSPDPAKRLQIWCFDAYEGHARYPSCYQGAAATTWRELLNLSSTALAAATWEHMNM